MTTPHDMLKMAYARHQTLTAELAVLDKFINDYKPAAIPVAMVVPADTPIPRSSKPGDIQYIGPDDPLYQAPFGREPPKEDKLGKPVKEPELESAEAVVPQMQGKLGPRAWTAEDDAALLAHRKHGWKIGAIADHLERTSAAVTERIAKLKVGAKPSDRWTAEDDDQLQLLYVERRESMAVIAGKLGRTRHAIRHHLSKLGLRRNFTLKPAPKKGFKQKKKAAAPNKTTRKKQRESDPVRKPVAEPSRMNAWTDREDRVLRAQWISGRISNYELAKRIGKPPPEIARRARQLNLGPRTKGAKTRKCMKSGCDTRFVPEDWKTHWYCDIHRNQMRHASEPALPQDPARSFQSTG